MNNPPKPILRFLRWFCHPDLLPSIEGDLTELYQERIIKSGQRSANWRFAWDVIKLFRPSIIRPAGGTYRMNLLGLLINHLKFSLRLFVKEKFYSSMNLIGLTIGLTCGIIVLVYINHEMSYDAHHENKERIYRLTNEIITDGGTCKCAVSARELPEFLSDNFPEVEGYVRFVPFYEDDTEVVVSYSPVKGAKKQFYEQRLWRTDSNAFEVFTHEFIEGDPASCLQGKKSIVITQSTAQKYFGDKSPIGEILTVEMVEKESFEVTAVIKDVPDNSHFKFDFLVSHVPKRPWVAYAGISHTIWNPDGYNYLLLPAGYSGIDLKEKFDLIFDEHFGELANELGGSFIPVFEPLESVHYQSEMEYGPPNGNFFFVLAFAGIAGLLIFMVCSNYVNLSTARALNRGKEIGVRKVLGGNRRALVISILSETYLLLTISFGLALLVAHLLFSSDILTHLLNARLELGLIENSILLWGLLGLFVLMGLLAGLYPGFFISGIPVLKIAGGRFGSSKSGLWTRKVLITVQFAIALLVVSCTVLMNLQLDFIRNKELGFKMDNVLLLKVPNGLDRQKLQMSTMELDKVPGVESITYASVPPGYYTDNMAFKIEQDTGLRLDQTNQLFVGDDYLQTMDIQLKEGRDFAKGSKADELQAFIVNEALVSKMGWKDSPIGKKIYTWRDDYEGSVIGVVKDHIYYSLHNKVEPLFIRLFRTPDEDEPVGDFHLKISNEDIMGTIAALEKKWNQIHPNEMFEMKFLDQTVNNQYEEDQKKGLIFSILSYLSIFISVLGLVGLTAYTASQRTKEIGLRKVLGAKVLSIAYLLNKGYVPLILVAILISFPIAHYLITQWLQNFAYHISIEWWYFIGPAFGIVLLTLMVVGGQSWRISSLNPVDSLRDE